MMSQRAYSIKVNRNRRLVTITLMLVLGFIYLMTGLGMVDVP